MAACGAGGVWASNHLLLFWPCASRSCAGIRLPASRPDMAPLLLWAIQIHASWHGGLYTSLALSACYIHALSRTYVDEVARRSRCRTHLFTRSRCSCSFLVMDMFDCQVGVSNAVESMTTWSRLSKHAWAYPDLGFVSVYSPSVHYTSSAVKHLSSNPTLQPYVQPLPHDQVNSQSLHQAPEPVTALSPVTLSTLLVSL